MSLFEIFFRSKYFHAALNSVMAMYTFQKMTPDERQIVLDQERKLLAYMGVPELKFYASFDENQLYGFQAYAMYTIGIPPAIHKAKRNDVRKPLFVEFTTKDKQASLDYINAVYGVDVMKEIYGDDLYELDDC